jgi:hypothetical protein
MAFYSVSCDDLSPSLLLDQEVLRLTCAQTIVSNFEKELSIISQHADLVQENAIPSPTVPAVKNVVANDAPSATPVLEGAIVADAISDTGAHLVVVADESQPFKDVEPVAAKEEAGGDITSPEPTVENQPSVAVDTSPTIVGSTPPANIVPPLERSSSKGEEEAVAAVDAAMAALIENDEKVSQMSSQMNCSRDECLFYLESTNYDLEKAIAIYKGFSVD